MIFSILKYFSQKKIIYSLLFILVFIGSIFMLFSFNSPIVSTVSFERNTANEAEEAFNAIVFKDSDEDGLKDWEETLWKTDPQNPDSDNDGTTDGEEVRLNRDPMKPAPNDGLEKLEIKKQESINSFTDSILKDTLSAYKLMQQPGVSNTQLLEKINKDLAQKIRTQVYNPDIPTYKIEDILTTEDNSENSIKKYKDQLRTMGEKYADVYESELIVIRKALSINDSKELKKLNKAIETYRNIIKDLLTITVPSNLAQTHLNILNTYSVLIDSVGKMREVLQDPVIGIAGILQYQRSSKNLIVIATELGFQKLSDINN